MGMELVDKENWGSWEFNAESLIIVNELNSVNNTADPVNPVYRALMEEMQSETELKESDTKESESTQPVTDLNEYSDDEPPDDSILECDTNCTKVTQERAYEIDFSSKTLIESIKDYYNCIHIIVNIMNNKNEEKLCEILNETWEQLTDLESKKRFILAIMTNDKAEMFCKKIILKWFQTGDFDKVYLNVAPVASLLDSYIVNEVAIPLMKSKDSKFVLENNLLKEFLTCLEKEQKAELMRSFLQQIGTKVSLWHFKIVTTLMEDNVYDDQIIENLLNVLQSGISTHNRDYFVGKLLMAVIDNLQLVSSYELKTMFAQIAENYQGTGKLSIRNQIKNLLSNN